MKNLVVFSILCIVSLASQAQTLSSVDNSFQNSIVKGLSLFTGYKSYYSSDTINFPKEAAPQLLRLGFNFNYSPKKLGFKVQSQFFTNIYKSTATSLQKNPKLNYDIRELSYNFKIKSLTWALGRKLHTWSLADQLWNNGFWQPRFNEDKSNPQQTGLIGFFAEYASPGIQFLAYASPLSIPETESSLHIENGNIISQNPWFSAPSRTLNIGSRITPLRYEVGDYSLKKLILKPGIGLSSAFQTKQNFFAKLSVAYKPLNQLLLQSKVSLQLRDSPLIVNATIIPNIQYHGIATLEAGFKNERSWTMWTSGTLQKSFSEAPVDNDVITQRIPSSTSTFTNFVGYNFSKNAKYKSELSASHTFINQGYITDAGELAKKESYFSSIYNYFNTAQLSYRQNTMAIFKKPVSYKLTVIYDFEQKVSAFSTKFNLNLNNKLTLYANTYTLGLHNKKIISPKGLLGKFFANDSVTIGAKYVF